MRDGPKVRLTGEPLDLRRLGTGGDRVVRFIQRFCRITKGRKAGQLVRLLPWQKEVVHGIFDEPRRRQSYVSLGRKNGKSYLAACIGLYALLADGEQGAEVYAIAGDERQARVAWNLARRMVELDERLSGVVQVFADRLIHEPSDSVFEPLPADADLRLGLNPSCVLFDEVAVQRSDDLWLSMQLAMGARERPVMVGITTPGFNTDSLAWRLTEHGREGTDPDFYFREWSAPAGCDVHDVTAWRAANPSLGRFLTVADMRASARSTPEHAFRRFRLGQWTETAEAWLPFGRWGQLAAPDRVVEGPVVLAFDGSASGDSTALVGATIEPEPHVFVLNVWANPGDERWRVPRAEVDAAVARAFERFDVRELACDPWGWRSEIETWSKRHAGVIEWPSNVAARMGPATDRFYQAVMEGRLSHDGDARLASHVGHATPKASPHGDLITKPSRNSPMKIDAAVCAVVAVDRAAFHGSKPPKRRRMVVLS